MRQTKRISRVLVAAENLLFRRGLIALVGGDPAFAIAGEVTRSADVVSEVKDRRPDVLVIDAELLQRSQTVEFGIALRQVQPGLLILVLAQQDSEANMMAAVGCGAKGFILKTASMPELMAALRNVAFSEGGMNCSGLLPEFQALAAHTPTNANALLLTAREQEVIKLLAEGKTVRAVASDLSLSMKTIEAHKLNLMRKLKIHDRSSLVAYASSNGLLATAFRAA